MSLDGLGGETVHQIQMHQQSGIDQIGAHRSGTGAGYSLVHQLEQPVVGALQTGGDSDASRLGHQCAQFRRKRGVEPDVAPPNQPFPAFQQLPRNRAQQSRGERLVGEVKRRDSGGVAHGQHRVHRLFGLRRGVPPDVIQRNIAKRASVPIATVGQLNLNPMAIRPQPHAQVGTLDQ